MEDWWIQKVADVLHYRPRKTYRPGLVLRIIRGYNWNYGATRRRFSKSWEFLLQQWLVWFQRAWQKMRFLDAVRARDYGLQSANDEEIFEVAVAEDRIVFIIHLCLCGIENFTQLCSNVHYRSH